MSLYDAIYESALLHESEQRFALAESFLVEDRMVKYQGELAPKFGWCVIYVGGPGSGKGTATKFASRLDGDYYNVDNLKEIERMWDIKNPETGRPRRDDFETPSKMGPKFDKEGNPVLDKEGNQVIWDTKRNMKNSDFVSELHYAMKPLAKKWENSILNNPENANDARRDRLPNIIFDVTGDDLEKIARYTESMKAVGYKIAIIWVLSTIDRAYRNNQLRDRTVNDDIFYNKHEAVLEAQKALFDTGYINNIDEFWVIDADCGINPHADDKGKSAKAYHDAQNVYHIPLTPDGLTYFADVCNRIEYNQQEIQRYYR